MLEAPGDYGCALAIGEGQSAGNFMSYGGPHYGFLAATAEHIRRLPGRIVGETVDAAGERGYVLTLQTREQHIRREKATSNITTNQTLLALAGLVHLSLLGPQGLRETGETCMALARVREGAAGRRAGSSCCFPSRQRSRSLPSASDGMRPTSIREARKRGREPGLSARPRLRRARRRRSSSPSRRSAPSRRSTAGDILADRPAQPAAYVRAATATRARGLP